jgi:peroxiredoxin
VNQRRRHATPVLVALVGSLVTLAGCTGSEPPPVQPSPPASTAPSSTTSTVGFTRYAAGQAPALPVLTGPDLTGATLTVPTADAAVSVVNVWASWCQPCVAEMPRLRSIATRFAAADVQVTGIATRDKAADAVGFLSATGFDLPSLADPHGAQAARWSALVPAAAVPSTLVVDASGRVRARWIGPVDEARLAQEVCATLRSENRPAATCPG